MVTTRLPLPARNPSRMAVHSGFSTPRPTLGSEGLRALFPAFFCFMAVVLFSAHDYQVLWPVVCLLLIDMMDRLHPPEPAAQDLLNNNPMLVLVLTVDPYESVAVDVDYPALSRRRSFLPLTRTPMRTEPRRVSPIRPYVKDSPATTDLFNRRARFEDTFGHTSLPDQGQRDGELAGHTSLPHGG